MNYNKLRLVLTRWPFLCLAEILFADAHDLFHTEILFAAAHKIISQRNHGKHRNAAFGLALLRSVWGTQMAQMTQIMFRAFLEHVIRRNYLYLPTEIMK